MLLMHSSSQFTCKFVRICILGFLAFLLIACGTGGNTGSTRTSKAVSPGGGSQQPSSQPAGQITEFSLPTANSSRQNGFPIAITNLSCLFGKLFILYQGRERHDCWRLEYLFHRQIHIECRAYANDQL